jgi:hypothetical protein
MACQRTGPSTYFKSLHKVKYYSCHDDASAGIGQRIGPWIAVLYLHSSDLPVLLRDRVPQSLHCRRMYIVILRMVRGVPPPRAVAAEIAAVLRDSARPGNGLEHVFAQQSERGVDVVLFLVASGPAETAVTACVLYQRAAPAIPDYQLVSCEIVAPSSLEHPGAGRAWLLIAKVPARGPRRAPKVKYDALTARGDL